MIGIPRVVLFGFVRFVLNRDFLSGGGDEFVDELHVGDIVIFILRKWGKRMD